MVPEKQTLLSPTHPLSQQTQFFPISKRSLQIIMFYMVFLLFTWCCTCITKSEDIDILPIAELLTTGPMLYALQMVSDMGNNDSKTLVDSPLKENPNVVQKAFFALSTPHTKHQMNAFVATFFEPVGIDILTTTPIDWQPTLPKTLSTQVAPLYQSWAVALHSIWKDLCRTTKILPNRQTVLHLPHPFIVPGGRFRESYYWDSYWIIQGLLASEMEGTARGIVDNFIHSINTYGFVPNGGRLYYLTRSQPPMLSEMILVLYEHTSDAAWLATVVPALEVEYTYWMTEGPFGHAVRLHGHVLNRYVSANQEPRPESYKEDIATASSSSLKNKGQVYADIIAAAESGWDFSSRWLSDGNNLNSISTSNVLAIDLNVYLHRMEKNLATFYTTLRKPKKALYYTQAALRRENAIQDLLWNETNCMWMDFLIGQERQSSVLSAASFFPLWSIQNSSRTECILDALQTSTLWGKGGIATSSVDTGQQWDGSNAWPPIQDIIVQGLLYTEHPRGAVMARELVRRWVTSNHAAWNESGVMYEKYNATRPGGSGSGGEYNVQVGFGWSNGVVLKFLTQYAYWL